VSYAALLLLLLLLLLELSTRARLVPCAPSSWCSLWLIPAHKQLPMPVNEMPLKLF
jgi:hypothetical protein